MRRFLLFVLLLLAVPVTSTAQQRRSPQRNVYIIDRDDDDYYRNRFSFDPYGGMIKDAYDIGTSGDAGYLFGFRVTYRTGDRTRLLSNFSYSNTENVANSEGLSDYYIYDNVWLMTTAGGEFDVVPGSTAAALGLQVGVGWRRVDLEEVVGAPIGPAEDTDEFTAYEMLLPSVTLRQRLSTRVAIALTAMDHMFDVFSGSTQHSPALVLGISLR